MDRRLRQIETAHELGYQDAAVAVGRFPPVPLLEGCAEIRESILKPNSRRNAPAATTTARSFCSATADEASKKMAQRGVITR